ncbi:hypothetical protein [Streptomyces sp. SJL17-1]|uniref:hypothetical protein n=1 Tax=Streptomyces sp. SJL17-1 TaxID=2967223 RepID=UPI002966BBB7|nr:hypothetical protein [Streptomyces sp. SJL17-1]
MSRHATDFVSRATARARLPLDYSVTSLRIVDRVVDGLRRTTDDPFAVRQALQGLGAYAGEVFVRGYGARWVDFDEETHGLFQQPVGIRSMDGRAWNPLGKVVNRFEWGAAESVHELSFLFPGRVRASPLTACAGGRVR